MHSVRPAGPVRARAYPNVDRAPGRGPGGRPGPIEIHDAHARELMHAAAALLHVHARVRRRVYTHIRATDVYVYIRADASSKPIQYYVRAPVEACIITLRYPIATSTVAR